ncbi:unnamed protein product [Pedinophyceae sp. YPF-701]|nr:unnamed protein product [Pedinophyceae sp. YPF-701]
MNGVAKPFRGPRRSRQSHGGSSASSKTSRQTDGELVVRNIVDMAASPASLRMSMRRRASLEATADGQEILCAAQSNKTARQRWRTAVRKIILTNMVSSQFSTLREMHSVPAIHPTQLQFIRQLGAGTFGRVQLMKLRKAGTPSSKVAMKILRRSTLTRSSCQDFVNEVSILRRLRHPNIIRFLGIGDDQGSPVLEPQVSLTDAVHTFLVLEYCSGGSLKDLIKKQMANGPGNLVFGHRDAFAWLCDVAEGLVYLHKSIPPVVHRDIKPDNVMLAHVKGRFGSGYTAKISDFGTSKVLGVETIMQKSVTFRKTVLRLSATGEAELADTAGGRSDFAPRESLGGAQSAVSEYLRQSVHLQRSVPSGELRVMEEKKRTAEMSRSQRNSALTDGGGSSHGARGAPHGVDVGSALELPPTPTPRTPGLEGLFPPLAEDEEEEEEEGYEGVLGKLAFEGSQREVTRPSLLARLFPCLGPKVAAVAPEQPAPAKDAKYAPLDLTGGTGSLLYMAPEVFRSEKYNARADVFSLGMLALELFSRCPLTTTHNLACSDDVVHFAQSISNGWRPDIPKKLPPPFKDFVKACLEHDPAVRPSAHAVVRMLQEMTPAMLKWAQQQDIAMARASMKYRAATEDQR